MHIQIRNMNNKFTWAWLWLKIASKAFQVFQLRNAGMTLFLWHVYFINQSFISYQRDSFQRYSELFFEWLRAAVHWIQNIKKPKSLIKVKPDTQFIDLQNDPEWTQLSSKVKSNDLYNFYFIPNRIINKKQKTKTNTEKQVIGKNRLKCACESSHRT